MSQGNSPNRINPTAAPVRMSTNLSIDRQTPKSDFGDRVKAGMDSAAGAVAAGASVVAPFVPGGAIVSAAVSSVTTMSAGGGSVGAQYSAISSIPAPMGTPGSINTTVASGGTGGIGGTVVPGPTGSGPFVPSTGTTGLPTTTGNGGGMGGFKGEIDEMFRANMELLKGQVAMQRESQMISTISNVLKVRHDTLKNTIQNVR